MTDDENPFREPDLQYTYVPELPPCDLHQARWEYRAASYDAKTRLGPWANLCTACFVEHGVGLGLGKGQRLFVGPPPTQQGETE